jgi:hypothetical protein
MDDIEREAIRAEGLDPDDPGVVMAIDLVPVGAVDVGFGEQVTGDAPA